MNKQDRYLIIKDNYKKILKDAKKIELETPDHFLTVMGVMLEESTNSQGSLSERWQDALNYLDTFIKYRSSFVRELLEAVNDK